jgi:hypothetical protein
MAEIKNRAIITGVNPCPKTNTYKYYSNLAKATLKLVQIKDLI